jgi:hypothetical protein
MARLPVLLVGLVLSQSLLGSPSRASNATSSQAATVDVPNINGVFGVPITFATHSDFSALGFAWGPADGQLGAIPHGDSGYTFYGSGASAPSCSATRPARAKEGVFAFTGSLDHLKGGNGCASLFEPGDAPAGWNFDQDYAGGGKVIRFSDGTTRGWLMPFHAEIHWSNPNTTDHLCEVKGGTGVPCFYSSLGLAISTDDGKTFKVVGQILQPSQPMSVFTGSGQNMAVGTGSFVLADADGNHLENPPPDPSKAYYYLFYIDSWPGLPGSCNTGLCMGVARAPYQSVIHAALSGDPDQVARLFRKYSGDTPDAWDQPATSDTPDESGTAGKFAPLWTDGAAGSDVLYDGRFNVYLTVVGGGSEAGIKVRASKDLIHWSEPIGDAYQEPRQLLWYPTLIGETGNPDFGGPAPRVYFSSFPVGKFPDYKTAILESVPLNLSAGN